MSTATRVIAEVIQTIFFMLASLIIFIVYL
jgi:hypothetical protein